MLGIRPTLRCAWLVAVASIPVGPAAAETSYAVTGAREACAAAGVRCNEPETVGAGYAESQRPTIRERAWTSPIGYTPR